MRRRLLCIGLLASGLLASLTGCQMEKVGLGLPDSGAVLPGQTLPIDGVWKTATDSGFGEFKVRIDRGRIIVLDNRMLKTGSVLVKDLKQVDGYRYTGTRLIGEGTKYYETHTTLELVSESELLEHIERKEGKGFWDSPLVFDLRYTKLETGSEKAKAEGTSRLQSVELVNLVEERLEVSVQEQLVDPGSRATIERSRTIEHVVNLDATRAQAAGLKLDLLSAIKMDVQTSIEKRFGRSLGISETYRVQVELDGNRSRRWKIAWYDRVKSGIARCVDDTGKIYEIPYRFVLATDLESTALE